MIISHVYKHMEQMECHIFLVIVQVGATILQNYLAASITKNFIHKHSTDKYIYVHQKTCRKMFITTVFILVKTWQ